MLAAFRTAVSGIATITESRASRREHVDFDIDMRIDPVTAALRVLKRPSSLACDSQYKSWRAGL